MKITIADKNDTELVMNLGDGTCSMAIGMAGHDSFIIENRKQMEFMSGIFNQLAYQFEPDQIAKMQGALSKCSA